MAYLGSWKIDDNICFYANTHNATTGAAVDADAVPTYRIYEDEVTTPLLTGSMALIDSANTAGFYSEQIQLTAASGFEKGKQYVIYITTAVNSVTGTMSHTLQIEAAVDSRTVSASNVSANVVQWLGQAAATVTNNGVPEVDITHIGGVAVSASTAQLGVNVVNFGGAAGTFASGRPEVNTTHAAGTAWESGAITAASIATDAIGAAELAADAVTEIANGVWGLDATGQQTAGTFGKAIGDPLASTNSLIQRTPDAVAGAANGIFIAGVNAPTTVTTSFTTTFTGNLTGSVDSVSGAVGSVTGLTASNLDATVSSRLAPTTAGRTLDVSTTGEAGVDWANVGGQGTTVTLSGTTVGTVSAVTGLTASNLDATVSSRLAPTVAARTLDVTATGEAGIDWNNIGSPTTSQTLSGTTVGTVTLLNGIGTNVITALSSDSEFNTEIANAVWGLDATVQQTQGTFGQAVGDPVAGTSLIARLPNATPGATGGVLIAGTNAPVTITTGLTTTFTGNLTGSVSSVTGAVGSVAGLTASNLDATVSSRASQTSVDTVDDFLDTEIADIQARLPAALESGRMASALDTTGIDAILNRPIDGTITTRQAFRIVLAALAGKVSGAATTTITIRGINDDVNRVIATVDADGNRAAITLDLT